MTVPATNTGSLLHARARYGDPRARRVVQARQLDRLTLLACAASDSDRAAAELTREAFAQALASRRPFDEAVVRAFGDLTTGYPARSRGRLLHVLVDVEGQQLPAVVAQLGWDSRDALALLDASRAAAGARLGVRCRGWGLAHRRGLTSTEQRVGTQHVALCRHCTEGLAALARERSALRVRATGVAGIAAGVQVATASAPLLPAIVGVLAGKAAAGVVGAVGVGVLAGGVATAIAQRPPTPATEVGSVLPSAPPGVTTPAGATPRPTPVRITAVRPSPVPSPTDLVPPGNAVVTVVPTGLAVPTALPTALPVPLPTLPVPTLPTLPSLPLLP